MTNNSNNCIKLKINYLISEAEILITAIVCLSEWYFKNIFLSFMQFTEKISLLTTIKNIIIEQKYEIIMYKNSKEMQILCF